MGSTFDPTRRGSKPYARFVGFGFMLTSDCMSVVSPLARELVFKVVYYGPGLGGKTTTLQYVHATAKPEHRGKMVSLATPVDRTLYFDFLPLRLPHVRNLSVRLQLFTVPGQVYYNATRKLVLTGVDGVVLVFDSQRARFDANLESLENLLDNLRAHGKTLEQLPHVVQYNKRDLYDVLPLDELERHFNRAHVPSFSTTATTGEGIYEALEAVTRAVLDDFDRRVPESRALDPAGGLGLPEGGLAEALRQAEAPAPVETVRPRAEPVVPERISQLLRLSQLPEADPGEAAARALAEEPRSIQPAPPAAFAAHGERPDSAPELQSSRLESSSLATPAARVAGSVSFEALWPAPERVSVRELEAALSDGDYAAVITLADRLVARVLASAGALLGGAQDAPRDPATVALLLGLDGRRYLELRSSVREARMGREPGLLDALRAYAAAIELRLLRAKIGN